VRTNKIIIVYLKPAGSTPNSKVDSMLLNFRGEKIFLRRHRRGNLILNYEIIVKPEFFFVIDIMIHKHQMLQTIGIQNPMWWSFWLWWNTVVHFGTMCLGSAWYLRKKQWGY